jgi:hypothetical protein
MKKEGVKAMGKYSNYLMIAGGVLLLAGSFFMLKQIGDKSTDFNPSTEQLATDLQGQVIGLPYGQAWPFDPTQKIQTTILGKKSINKLGEDFMVVFANVQAQADVTPVKNKDEKEAPKEKLPKRVALNGLLKMHYEQVNGQWYLVFLEGFGMKATPLPD